MSNLLKLARKFELKLLAHDENYAKISLDEFKIKAKSELIEIIDRLAKIVRSSQELREVANFASDPFAQFGERGSLGIISAKKIIEKISQLYTEKDNLSLEKMAVILIDISELIISEVAANGSDKWGIKRSRFLNLVETYGDYFTTQGTYSDPSILNSMAKRFIEEKIGRLTHTFDTFANQLRNARETGAIDILKNLSSHGLIDSTRIDNLIKEVENIGDTSRLTRNLENHEKENFIRLVFHLIGLSGVNAIHEWNEFIEPYKDMVKLATSIWFTSQFKKLWGKMPKSTIEKVVQEAPSILPKLQILKAHIVPLVNKSKEEQKNKEEKAVGRIPIPSPILPKKNERELISGLSADERRIWSTLTQEEKKEILSGNKDLDDVLEEQQRKLGL